VITSYELMDQQGQESSYAKFHRVECLRKTDPENAKRLSHWYWRRDHYACGQQEFPLLLVSEYNREVREAREEAMKLLAAVLATVGWLVFAAWITT